ncbi:hypothetical protein Tco_0635909, partial [Tanacetum coccineum]
MATMAENVIAVGKDNGEMLKDSVKHGPYKFKSEITVKDTDGVTDIRHAERLEDLKGDDKTQATIQNGQVTVQNVQGRHSQGYAGNAENNQASGTRVINSVGNTRANQPRLIRCYNYKGEGHMAKQCTADHVDASDSDCDDEATTNAIFMANLSPVGSLNDDTVVPRYDSNILFE